MGRIKTIHGVHIPPRKKKDGRQPGCKFVTLDFVITGTIPSKKNRQIPSISRPQLYKILERLSNGSIGYKEAIRQTNLVKPFIRNSKKFKEWHEAKKALVCLQAQTWGDRLKNKGHDILFPISDASISIYHYWKDNVIRDNSNKSETLHDLFVDAGITVDDCWQALTPIHADANLYDGEITDHITEIQITAYNWIK